MIEYSLHADMLARAGWELARIRDDGMLLDASDWIFAAASVVKVDAMTAKHDYTVDWCSSAADYEDRRSLVWGRHLTELSIFSLAWSGFECMGKAFLGRRQLRDGLLPAVESLIRSRETNEMRNAPLGEQLVAQSKALAHHLEDLQRPARHHLAALDILMLGNGCPAVNALNAIRKLRNAFAHGATSMPYPDDDDLGDDLTGVLAASNRLLIFGAQYFMCCSVREDESMSEVFLPYNGVESVPLRPVLLAGASFEFEIPENCQFDLFD